MVGGSWRKSPGRGSDRGRLDSWTSPRSAPGATTRVPERGCPLQGGAGSLSVGSDGHGQSKRDVP